MSGTLSREKGAAANYKHGSHPGDNYHLHVKRGLIKRA